MEGCIQYIFKYNFNKTRDHGYSVLTGGKPSLKPVNVRTEIWPTSKYCTAEKKRKQDNNIILVPSGQKSHQNSTTHCHQRI